MDDFEGVAFAQRLDGDIAELPVRTTPLTAKEIADMYDRLLRVPVRPEIEACWEK